MEPKRVFFPDDETEHNHIIEWWYFNGNLKDSKGKDYAFMNCLFKADMKKIKLPVISDLLPVKTLFFSHSILSDIGRTRVYPNINYVVRPSDDSFKKSRLFVKYGNCLIEKTGESKYHIKNDTVDLKMKSMKAPMLEGRTGFFNLLGNRSTYYYSLTDLRTEGTIMVDGKRVRVRGRSWMDHQWANNRYAKDKWSWFSMQLENGMDIMCFEYGRKKKNIMACIMDSKGRQTNIKKISITPTKTKWTSPHTKATYPMSWRVEIPGKNMTIELESPIREQEMLFGTINYWEGPLTVRAKIGTKIGSRIVKGKGFMELMGYMPKCSLPELIKHGFEEAVLHEFRHAKDRAKKILD
jgi:predicted secreted hydrolase